VDSPNWKAAGVRAEGRFRIAPTSGMHLNLTEVLQAGSSTWRLPSLLVQSMLSAAAALASAQSGRAGSSTLSPTPSAACRIFVDGHHHVHQLPVVRDVLIESVPGTRAPSRCRGSESVCRRKTTRITRPRGIGMLGASIIARAWRTRRGFPNQSLSGGGLTAFNLRRDAYLARVRKWLEAGSEGAVFIVPPVDPKASAKDPIGAAPPDGARGAGR